MDIIEDNNYPGTSEKIELKLSPMISLIIYQGVANILAKHLPLQHSMKKNWFYRTVQNFCFNLVLSIAVVRVWDGGGGMCKNVKWQQRWILL